MTEPAKQQKISKRNIVVILLTIFGIIALAILGERFAPQPFSIPSASNEPTILSGDSIFIWRYAYRDHMPARGDMAVFTDPHTGDDFIKRVVGLPGDRIQVTRGVLIINGEASRRERIADYHERDWDEYYNQVRNDVRYHYRETLPNGSVHEILGDLIAQPEDSVPQDNTSVFQVPDGRFFAIGDNRDNSNDSRLQLGYVPLANLIGRAGFCYFSSTKIPDGTFHIRWDRMFRSIH
jgi:signal peptidase I